MNSSTIDRSSQEHIAVAEMTVDSLRDRDLSPLLDEICRLRAVTRVEVCGFTRTRALSHARHELWWRLRHHPNVSFSFEEIARLFHRDHSTVLQGVRAHARRLADDGNTTT